MDRPLRQVPLSVAVVAWRYLHDEVGEVGEVAGRGTNDEKELSASAFVSSFSLSSPAFRRASLHIKHASGGALDW